MERLRVSRPVMGMSVAMAMLAGCGGGASGSASIAMAPSAAHRATSTSGALIYATGGCGGACVLSYPGGQIVGSISQSGGGPCSDAAGNVFVPDGSQIFEYQHGGTTPIATLTMPQSIITSYNCSVDPTTNNLAVSYLAKTCICVAVFNDESGVVTSYSTGIDSFFCGYDNAGNLFVDGLGTDQNPGIELSELALGQSEFTPLTVKGKLQGLGRLQWDGAYLTHEGAGAHAAIMRLAVSGSVATVVKTVSLNGNIKESTLSWIYNGSVLMPYSIQSQRLNKIGLWAYPKGGKRKAEYKFANSKYWAFSGVTVSVAPTRK